MGYQKIQSRWHRLHRLLWLEIARGLEKDPRECVAELKVAAFERLLAKFKITEIQGHLRGAACFACVARTEWRTMPGQTSYCACPLQWTAQARIRVPCLNPASEYENCNTAADARKIAYMKWHEGGVNPKELKCTPRKTTRPRKS